MRFYSAVLDSSEAQKPMTKLEVSDCWRGARPCGMDDQLKAPSDTAAKAQNSSECRSPASRESGSLSGPPAIERTLSIACVNMQVRRHCLIIERLSCSRWKIFDATGAELGRIEVQKSGVRGEAQSD